VLAFCPPFKVNRASIARPLPTLTLDAKPVGRVDGETIANKHLFSGQIILCTQPSAASSSCEKMADFCTGGSPQATHGLGPHRYF